MTDEQQSVESDGHAPGSDAPRLTDHDERRIRVVVLEWLNEAEVAGAQQLARKIAANLRPTIDAGLALEHHHPGSTAR